MHANFSSVALPVEKQHLDLGYVALTDSAPLIVAERLGIFQKWGLEVELRQQPSWATIRDRLQGGLLDAAQLLAPMPLAARLGLNRHSSKLISAMNLSYNGNAVTLSLDLFDQIKALNGGQAPSFPLASHWLQQIIEYRNDLFAPKLKLACVYPYSCHYYQLHDWLTSARINVEQDIELLFIAPGDMTQALQENHIDGFCAGNPWNTKAVRDNLGVTVLTSNDVWPETPEKVLAVTEQWQQQYPNTYLALVAAIQQACDWLATPANRFEAALMLQPYINEPINVLAPSLVGSCLTQAPCHNRYMPDLLRFKAQDNNQPSTEQGLFLLDKMRATGHCHEEVKFNLELINKVYRHDLYQDAMGLLNQLGEA